MENRELEADKNRFLFEIARSGQIFDTKVHKGSAKVLIEVLYKNFKRNNYSSWSLSKFIEYILIAGKLSHGGIGQIVGDDFVEKSDRKKISRLKGQLKKESVNGYDIVKKLKYCASYSEHNYVKYNAELANYNPKVIKTSIEEARKKYLRKNGNDKSVEIAAKYLKEALDELVLNSEDVLPIDTDNLYEASGVEGRVRSTIPRLIVLIFKSLEARLFNDGSKARYIHVNDLINSSKQAQPKTKGGGKLISEKTVKRYLGTP